MNYIKLILLTLACGLMVACDPVYSVDIVMKNQTSQSVRIVTQSGRDSAIWDTNIISEQTSLTLVNMFAIGSTTDRFLDNMSSLPYQEINITTQSGKVYTKDLLDIENWEKIYPKKKENTGTVKLIVRDQDF